MGGSAFHLLDTPRLPPELYFQLRDRFIALFRQHFEDVAVPIEAPGKTSHGDIDFIALSEDPSSTNVTIDKVATILNAEAKILSGPTKSLAIPCPELGEKKFVQLDIHRCSKETFSWEVFHHCHGDLWNLLGACVRGLGFTPDDRGFHVRVKEIEAHNKKASRLLLSSDPQTVLEFLGLDVDRYWKPFTTPDQMYEYVASNRLFKRRCYIREDLKRNDKVRMSKRDMFRVFVDEWLPAHPEFEGSDEKTREEHLEDVLGRFNKRAEYEEKVVWWREGRVGKAEKKRRILEARAAAEVGCFA